MGNNGGLRKNILQLEQAWQLFPWWGDICLIDGVWLIDLQRISLPVAALRFLKNPNGEYF
jgi:hypothetical protein